MGEMVEQVTVLKHSEAIRLNSEQLETLYVQLGERTAEDVVCRALEDLAVRLAHTERCWRESAVDDMRKTARSLIAIAEQVGMQALARVAGDVVICLDRGDEIATAATLSRLIRIGEQSLCEIWDLQDLSL